MSLLSIGCFNQLYISNVTTISFKIDDKNHMITRMQSSVNYKTLVFCDIYYTLKYKINTKI